MSLPARVISSGLHRDDRWRGPQANAFSIRTASSEPGLFRSGGAGAAGADDCRQGAVWLFPLAAAIR